MIESGFKVKTANSDSKCCCKFGWQRLPVNSYTKEVCQFGDQRLPENSYTKEVCQFGDQRLPANSYSKEVCQFGDQRLPANSYTKEYETNALGQKPGISLDALTRDIWEEDAIISPREQVYRLLPRDPVNRSTPSKLRMRSSRGGECWVIQDIRINLRNAAHEKFL
ncbi:hypothetical protein Tco_0724347 [Tanacetum coccineum]